MKSVVTAGKEHYLSVPLACDMTAIPLAERGEHQRATERLVTSAIEVQETQDGFAFQLPADSFDTAVQFVARERLCCPFLRFSIEVTPGSGPVWLRVDGPAGAGAFLRSELRIP